MAGVQRMGDMNSRGGVITFPNQLSVSANFIPIAVGQCLVASHAGCPDETQHCAALTVPIFGLGVTAENQTVVVTGDTDTCGDTRALGSLDVNIG